MRTREGMVLYWIHNVLNAWPIPQSTLLLSVCVAGSWIACIIVFLLQFHVPAIRRIVNYGRRSVERGSGGWGIRYRVAWISFYAIGIVLTIVFHMVVPKLSTRRIHIVLFQIQLLRRLYECLFVHQYSHAKMPILSVMAGIAFYSLAALSVHVSAPVSFTSQEFWHALAQPHCILSQHAFNDCFPDLISMNVSKSTGGSLDEMLAMTMFVLCSAVQHFVHVHLSNLRPRLSPDSRKAGKAIQRYKVPTSVFFRYTASPHYLCEIGIYLALAMLAGRTSGMWPCFFFVVSNLAVGAHQSRKWYVDKFPQSNWSSKCRLVPFLW
eukprot:ANDGO_08017.mRNA.1 Polyprenol reductase 2